VLIQVADAKNDGNGIVKVKYRYCTGTQQKPYNYKVLKGATVVNSALHSSGVAKSSTSFGWDKGANVSSAGWQVTLCDPIWHVSSRSGVATLRTAIHLLLT